MTVQEIGEPNESLSTQLYRTLREQIIIGQHPQGSLIKEAKLAADLHVSRIPLREAMPQLENDGFVRTLPRRSTRVAEWTASSILELFDVRLSLEVLAARLAAHNAAAGASTAPLAEAIEVAHAAVDSGTRLEIAEAHTIFHQRIVELADSELLNSMMRAVFGRMTWLFYLTAERDPRTQSHEHDDLMAVIASGNERLAESVAYAHIEKGRVPSLSLML